MITSCFRFDSTKKYHNKEQADNVRLFFVNSLLWNEIDHGMVAFLVDSAVVSGPTTDSSFALS
jgi:hypothetical protein